MKLVVAAQLPGPSLHQLGVGSIRWFLVNLGSIHTRIMRGGVESHGEMPPSLGSPPEQSAHEGRRA